MEFVPALAALAFVAVIVLIVLYLSVRVVQQYERMVVFRLGKTNEAMVREPGLRFLIPLVDRPVKVDMREQFIEVPSQTTITKDNAPINVDFLIYWRIADALYSVVNVNNFAGSAPGRGDHHAARGHRRHPPRRRAVQARADQRGPAGQAGRGHRALGRQDHDGRDPRDHAAAGRPGRDEPAAVGRADAARGHHGVRGRPPVRDQRRRRPEAVRRSCGPRATGRPRSSARRGSARRWSGSSRPRPRSTPRRWRSSTSRRSSRSARARRRSTSSRPSSRASPSRSAGTCPRASPKGRRRASPPAAHGRPRRTGSRRSGRRHRRRPRRYVIRRALVAVAAPLVAVAAIRPVTDGMARRLMAAPRTGARTRRGSGPRSRRSAARSARIRARDGLRLAGRWLPAEPAERRRLDARPARGRAAPPRLDGLGRAGPRRARAVPAPDRERAGARLPRARRLGRRPDDVRRARGRGRGGGPRVARGSRRPPGGARGLVDGRGHGAGGGRRARGRALASRRLGP